MRRGFGFLQVLELLGLFNSQATVLSTPAIVGLLGDADLPAGFGDGDTLVNVDLSFPQLVHSMVTTSEICSPSVYRCDL